MTYQDWGKYESEERWTSYYVQVDNVLRFKPSSCLEVGVGNGIVSETLRRQGVLVTTLDVDPALHPDKVGSVERIPAEDSSYDIVLCAEVLEHLPFEQFERCVSEIARVARIGAVISLPHWGYTIRVILDLPGIVHFRRALKSPFTKTHDAGGEHYWEIGKRGYPPVRVRKVLEKYFDIEREWLSPWMPYHRFYRLCKRVLVLV